MKKAKAERRLKEIEEAREAWKEFKKTLCEELRLEQFAKSLSRIFARWFGRFYWHSH